MTDFAALKLLAVISGGLSGEPELHPRVTFPMEETRVDRLQELYGECDVSFRQLPSYKTDISLVGFYERPWITSITKVGDGILTGYLTSTISTMADTFKERAERLYRSNVNPIDQELIRLSRHGYYSYLNLKKLIFGQYQLAQGEFFGRLEGQDYLGALRQANRMTDVGFDRLRGNGARIKAVADAQFITLEDKKAIKTTMGRFVQQYEKELFFWWGRALGLRELYDLMHHIVDDCRVLQYQEKTGCPKEAFIIRHEEWTLDSLYLELQAAFHKETCNARVTQGVMSRAMEFALNQVASYFETQGGAKEPRAFPEVIQIAKKRIHVDYDSLKGYEEVVPFSEQDKTQEFLDAVTKDHFLFAKQIALNGQIAKNHHYPWEKEQFRLDSYKEVLTTLFRIQDEFFILKYKICQRLKTGQDLLKTVQDLPLKELFVTIDQAEYTAFQERILLKQAYQVEIQKEINGLSNAWDQIKSSATEGLRGYLLQGQIFDQTPSFDSVMDEIRARITIYCGYMLEVAKLLGEPYQKAFADFDHGLSKREKVSPSAKREIPTFEAASLHAIDEMARKAYQRFYTPLDYRDLVASIEFEKESRIGVAIVNCRENIKLETPHWNWLQELEELEKYRVILKELQNLNTRSDGAFCELQEEWLNSFRKKVVTDCSSYLSLQSVSLLNQGQNMVGQALGSLWRKGRRLYEGKSPLNTAANFRDPKFQLLFMEKLKRKQNDLLLNEKDEVHTEYPPALVEQPQLPALVEETVERLDQKIFTPTDYYEFITSREFEETPFLAEVFVNCREGKKDGIPQWEWDEEKAELEKYCQFVKRVHALKNADPNLVVSMSKELLESFRKKVVTDHSAYVYRQPASLFGQGQSYLSLGVGSLWRKGLRAYETGSIANSAPSFRDQEFQVGFEAKLREAENFKE